MLPIAQGHIRAAGLADRVTVREGDLRTDALGAGQDLILVSAICHMLGEDENQDLLDRCARAMAPGGRVAIREFILDPDRAGPPTAALVALNMIDDAIQFANNEAIWMKHITGITTRHLLP